MSRGSIVSRLIPFSFVILFTLCQAVVGHSQEKPAVVSGCDSCGGDACGCFTAGLFWADPSGITTENNWAICESNYSGYLSDTYVGAEYLALFRDTHNPQPAIAGNPGFDGDFASGVLLTLGTRLGDRYRVEASYFGTPTWNEATLLNGNPISMSSEVSNLEFVLRHHVPTFPDEFEASFLIGGRFLDIEDNITFIGQQTRARNELFGLQIGMLTQYLANSRTWIDWELKGALANNEAAVTGIAQQNVTSFVGETSVVLNYQFLPSMTFRAGYRGIWATGLALGIENVNAAVLNDSGEMIYHGLNVGLVWSW